MWGLRKLLRAVPVVISAFAAMVIWGATTAQAAECSGASQDMMIVLFDFDSDQVKETYNEALKKWAARAQNSPVVCIAGWADKKGNVDYNKKLALRRAESVANILEREGVKRSIMDIRSIGEALGDKIAAMQTEAKQARRVEVSYGK